MKKIILFLSLSAMVNAVKSQGLERVIVEKYYVAEPNDTLANIDGGVLPVGSVTYRIFVDMLPGYSLQACYGEPGVIGQCPSHDLKIETTTLFFNNEDRGSVHPTYNFSSTDNNTVMLDSWLSMGAGCNGWFGVMKSEDNGVNTVVNSYSPQVLQNNNAALGIPLTQEDGLIQVTGRTPVAVTEIGLTSPVNILGMFDNQNDGTNGPSFITNNGAWSALGGAVGPDSTENKVLIGQITTDGVFSFELNLQLGTPVPGFVEKYVATNAACGEIQDSSLIYNSAASGVGMAESSNNKFDFSIYRNPTSDYLNMLVFAGRRPAHYSYAVYTIEGRRISTRDLGTCSHDFMEKVDLTGVSSGTYVVVLTADGVSTSRKVVKY